MPEKLTPSDIATVLRRLRKGDKALLDKKKALADLGYGSERNVEEELEKANNYRGSRGLPPLDLSSKNYKYRNDRWLVTKPDTTSIEVTDAGESGRDVYSYYPTADDHGKIGLGLEPETIEYDSKINALLKGDILTPEGAVGHELSHALTRSEFPFYDKLGKSKERHITYPELDPAEFAPPLAALTRLEYQKTGERIDTPEKFDKKIAEYDAMSSEEKIAFRKKLPTEVSRFYGYLDAVSDPKAEDIYLQGPEKDETPPRRYAGKDTKYHTGGRGGKYDFLKRDIDAGLRVFGLDINDYDDMKPEQRDSIKRKLREMKYGPNVRPSRKTHHIAARRLDDYDDLLKIIGQGYRKENYLDKHGLKGGEKDPVKVEGKDRRKRFLDISREMIPSLVDKEDSFEEAVNRRLS